MALERLQSVFNDIYQNEVRSIDDLPSPSIDEIGDDHFYGSGFFDSINQVLQPDGTYQPYGSIPIMATAEDSPMSKKLLLSEAQPSINGWSGYENQNGVRILDTSGTQMAHQGMNTNTSNRSVSQFDDESDRIVEIETNPQVRFRHIGGANIGKDNALGKGKYVLESMFDRTHGSSQPGGRPAGIGDSSNLDIKSHGDRFRGGFGGILKEPYIIHNIPKDRSNRQNGQDREFLPFRAAADDVLRVLNYTTSPKGLLSLLQENITNYAIGDGLDPFNILSSVMAPPIPVPMTGFLNFYQQSLQGKSLIPGGGSARKPFRIEYSKRGGLGLPFNNLGDKPIGLEIFQKIKLPEGEGRLAKLGRKILKPIKDKAAEELTKVAQIPKGRPSRFTDLSGGGKKTSYDDTITKSGIEETFDGTDDGKPPLEQFTENIKKGDFYVRFKDLRDNRFIYFRGFVTGINENITPSFSPTQYIGRSEDVYIYQKAERDLSFNLKVYPFNVSEFERIYEKIDKLTSLAYPSYMDLEDGSLSRMKAPFTELYMAHIGDRVQGQFGFIKSLTYTVPDGGDWDSESALPRMFDISISYQILNRRPPQMGTRFYRGHGEYTG